MSEQEILRLKNSLEEDFTGATKRAQEKPGLLGVAGPQTKNIVAKSVRTKRGAVAQAEMDQLNMAIQNATEKLSFEAKLMNANDQERFRAELNKRMNQLRVMAVKQAGNFQIESVKRGLSQEEKQAMYGMMSQMFGGIAQGVVYQVGGPRGGPPAKGSYLDEFKSGQVGGTYAPGGFAPYESTGPYNVGKTRGS